MQRSLPPTCCAPGACPGRSPSSSSLEPSGWAWRRSGGGSHGRGLPTRPTSASTAPRRRRRP
eukprot:6020013-Alexandrium_andersonii.AAC.1